MKPHIRATFPITLVGLALLTALTQTSSQTHQASRLDPDTMSKHVSAHSNMPQIGESETKESPDALAHRRLREELHRNTYDVIQDPGRLLNGKQETIHFRIIDAVTIDDGSGDTDDLPVHWARAILISTVPSGKAFLSQHRTYVYSDFQIKIERILKPDLGQPLFVDESITAERQGGTIHFPSGHIRHFLISRQGFPGAGRRYLFFLTRPNPNIPEYLIITAYELRSGIVLPLDEDSSKQFEGMKVGDFISSVQRAITQRGQ